MTDANRIDRREALLLFAAGAAMLRLGAAGAAAAVTPQFVSSDFARLRRVLMCPPSKQLYDLSRFDDDVVPMSGIDREAAVAEHAELIRALRSSGAEVLLVPDLLQAAIERSRSRGTWDTWLRATHPQLSADQNLVTAQTLLGLDPATQYRTWPDGTYRHIMDTVSAFIFSRDTAVTTSKGVILLNVGAVHRAREQVLLRLMFAFSPQL